MKLLKRIFKQQTFRKPHQSPHSSQFRATVPRSPWGRALRRQIKSVSLYLSNRSNWRACRHEPAEMRESSAHQFTGGLGLPD
jgi:hypothetical protein